MKKTKLIAALWCGLLLMPAVFAAPGIAPVDAKGRRLNLDFEEGSLKDWTPTGAAFDRQPVRGDTVSTRRSDMKSNHQGEFWIGTYEFVGDNPKGTLTSAAFKVTQPYASFRVAGGTFPTTRVELVRADTKQVFFKISGTETETLRPVVVDLRTHADKEIFIRIVDEQSGGWGHINFDDFKFYAARPTFPDELDPAKAAGSIPPPADVVKFAGLSPEDAAREATVPPGFKLQLFAGEPDVKQPIAFALDDRGRIWVAEAYTYPRRAAEGQGKDRILIFEDTDGDGRFDKRTVFIENMNLISGLEVGFGGVWVGAAPYLMFIPDRNHDDVPDGKPEIILDGFDYRSDTHETLNTFCWGPDGWLYGCHGVFTDSRVGKPGTSNNDRVRLNAGVWRFHPTRHTFEVFAEGTSNPWGVDFDEHGQCMIEACVIPHFFHMIQGGRFERQAGQHFNPYVYDDIKTIADHRHYAGDRGPHAANGRSDAMGGGHAHAGMLFYQGGSFPKQYYNAALMNNIHGQRLNMDVIERRGSGYVAHHAPDFVNFNDTWSQILNMISDQDGSVYMIDWYDKNQCHHNNVEGHDRSNGRIFKLVYNNQKTTKVNLAEKSNEELVELLSDQNIWYARHAQRLLQERGAQIAGLLQQRIASGPSDLARMHALWALQVTSGVDDKNGLPLLRDQNEFVRAWAIQFLAENKNPSDAAVKEFARLASEDPSPVVRLYVASALQRTPVAKRWDTLKALLAHGEDGDDHNLPLMYWYAAEAAVGSDPAKGLQLLGQTKIPKVREFITRRLVSSAKFTAAN